MLQLYEITTTIRLHVSEILVCKEGDNVRVAIDVHSIVECTYVYQ
jgi:hypothetical protein